MTGSAPFSIEPSDNFKRSFKKLAKTYKTGFLEAITQLLEDLTDDPYPAISRDEPLPSKIKLPQGWTFHKLKFILARGASGQIRLMYLVNEDSSIIKPLWIYNHEQFVKRPPEKDLKMAIQEAFEE